jgi:protein-S-isoprenylcysteine O-methyltransferase Ste14
VFEDASATAERISAYARKGKMSKRREPIFTREAPGIILCSILILVVVGVMYWAAIALLKAVLIVGALVLISVALLTLIWAIRSGALTFKRSIRLPTKRRKVGRKQRGNRNA